MGYLNRVNRVYYHLMSPWRFRYDHIPYRNFIIWTFDWFYILLDLFYVDKMISFLLSLFLDKKPLSAEQKSLGMLMFGESIAFDQVSIYINMQSRLRRFAYAYVVFNTINFNCKIKDDILIHEYVHIWQYQKFGSVYIFRALLAQKSREGYDYGGVEALYNGMISGKKLLDFNFEQQAEIVQNAFLQIANLRGVDNNMYRSVYKYYTNQLLD